MPNTTDPTSPDYVPAPAATPAPAPPAPATYTPTPVPPPATSTGGGLLAQTVGTPQQPQPPIDPNVYENDSSVSRVNDITSQDSPYMQVARTAGLQTANRRGLLNSSIAAGASEASAIAAAAPLATTDAQIAGSRNLARVQAYFTGQQQQADIAAREQMLGSQLSNEQLLQTRDIASRLQMQQLDFTNQNQLQQAQIAATQQLTQMNIQAESDRLGRQLTSQEQQQQADIAAQQARLAMTLASQEGQNTASLANQLNIAHLDATTRTQLEAMQNLSDNQRSALSYYLGQNQIYAQGIDAMWQNENLPAPARDQAMQQLLSLRNSGVDLPAALFGIQMSWPNPPSTGSTGGFTLPPPPPVTQGTYPGAYTGPDKAAIAAMQHDGTKGNYAAAVQAWNAAHPNDQINASSGGSGNVLTNTFPSQSGLGILGSIIR